MLIFQVCSCNIARFRAGEPPSSDRESKVNLGFLFKILTQKKIIKIIIFEIKLLLYDTLFFKLLLKIQ